ncbi:MAG: hypothetical protein EOP49_40695 [Sphingobacteriales bacterium]|nr:MAG: hypothetical protein EOP49_40695 [Sphingobacteriales bacterium]
MMQRAVIFYAEKKWDKALPDYTAAAELYAAADDLILGVEARRMQAYVASKSGDSDQAAKALVLGIRLGKDIPANMIHGTTYAALIDELLNRSNFKKYITEAELTGIAKPIYGNEWVHAVRNWKKVPEASDNVQTI